MADSTISSYFRITAVPEPYKSYPEYTDELFALADYLISSYLSDMKTQLATEQGGYRNALYPDIELAADSVSKRLISFGVSHSNAYTAPYAETSTPPPDEQNIDDDLMSLFGDDMSSMFGDISQNDNVGGADFETAEQIFAHIESRIAVTSGIPLPFVIISDKLALSRFSRFCLSLALLSCSQTSYASVFQIINQNSSLSSPTVEAAARIYFGSSFNAAICYAEMSRSIEQLQPIIFMSDNSDMPFSSVLTADKRLIDYMYSDNPYRIDPQYSRFCMTLADDSELDPILANNDVLDGISISYGNDTRIFSLFGDEGSGRRFTVRHFCRAKNFGAVSVNAGKLFSYDFRFVERALWGISRECIFSDAVCCLNSLSYHEEEKEKFFGYLDLAFGLLSGHAKAIFTLSEEKLPLRECTSEDFTQLELPIPSIRERDGLWEYYAKNYELDKDVDLLEMSSKFLFTGGKIKNSLRQGLSLSEIHKETHTTRHWLFESCYGQMKHELTQKATKVKATYTWDDIIMPADQRQTLDYVCDHMTFRKRVYEDWNYNRKYPYGRGLSVLLFGHPGTGKTMCAQVLANALNLELYRVDLSKVIDKYVGETEKSISMIFREAKKCNVVLFFDECDTLFGKRTDSGGSGEQSANNKTAHLLQEVEAYDGVSVLATNFKHNIDPAFFRRMKFVVEFQFPDPETRYRIWSATIPKQTPLAEDVDLRFLADKFEFVGGNIKNCILNSAFLAAADGDGNEVGMKHLLLAIKFELIKTGKVFTRTDFEPYAHLIM